MMMLRWTESGVCGEPDSGRKLELGRGRGLHILRPGSPKVWLVWLALGWGGRVIGEDGRTQGSRR